MRPLYIFDLDGTLADLTHRRHFVSFKEGARVAHKVSGERGTVLSVGEADWATNQAITVKWDTSPISEWDSSQLQLRKDWGAFHAACVDDKPIWPVITTLNRLGTHIEFPDIWIWSGRMETVRQQTLNWLSSNDVCFDELKMRPADDYTVDWMLKESWLNAMSPEDRARLVAVFDDRQQVVDMWRRNGIQCFQVAPGDF